jgi:hypothetical protein
VGKRERFFCFPSIPSIPLSLFLGCSLAPTHSLLLVIQQEDPFVYTRLPGPKKILKMAKFVFKPFKAKILNEKRQKQRPSLQRKFAKIYQISFKFS